MSKTYLIGFGMVLFVILTGGQTVSAKMNECVELSGNTKCRQVDTRHGKDFTLAHAKRGDVAVFTEPVSAGPGAVCTYSAESRGSSRRLVARLLLADGSVRDIPVKSFSRSGKWQQHNVSFAIPAEISGPVSVAFYEQLEGRGHFFVREGAQTKCRQSESLGASAFIPSIGGSFSPAFFLPREIDLNSYKQVMATVFWVGEPPNDDNGQISNSQSAWNAYWQETFGGFDDPEDRCGFYPCSFTPLDNPFYVALPYNDLDFDGNRKPTASLIPWFSEYQHLTSVMKNRWVEIRANGNTCYGQLEDSGPNVYDDFEYVFGDQPPQNPFGVQAGIDVSPALKTCLEMSYAEAVEWRFVADSEVPEGPWRAIVTERDVNW